MRGCSASNGRLKNADSRRGVVGEDRNKRSRAKEKKKLRAMSGEDVAKAFVAHFYSKFANNGAQVKNKMKDGGGTFFFFFSFTLYKISTCSPLSLYNEDHVNVD